MMTIDAIVVAAGSARRFGSAKMWCGVGGRAVVWWSVMAMLRAPGGAPGGGCRES